MAHSNAVQLAGYVGAAITGDGKTGIITAYKFVGDGSGLSGIDATSIKDSGGTVRAQAYTAGVTVTGVLTATSFDGDGSALTGLPAGLGTAIAASGDGALFYYTDQTLDIGANLTLDTPATTPIYTQYADIAVASGVDLTVADGDELVTDVLGIGTAGTTALSGTGGRVRADTVTSRTTLSPVDFPSGITGVAATFTGNVTVGGTITYDDVTNVDSVGIVTARAGVLIPDGSATATRLGIGNDVDLALYHNGSNSFVVDRGTGPLYIRGNNAVRIESYVDDSNGEPMIVANTDGAVELYHDNSKKLETTAAGITVTGTVTDDKGDVRLVPQNHQTSAYILAATDSGKLITITTGGITVDASIMSQGDMVTIINHSGSDQTITQGSGVSIYNTADATSGNRTLAGRGMATLWFLNDAYAYISGSGLS